MALVKCPECGKENVSDTAKSCPNCGYGIKEHFDNIREEEEERIRIAEEEKRIEIEREQKEREEQENRERQEREAQEYAARYEKERKEKAERDRIIQEEQYKKEIEKFEQRKLERNRKNKRDTIVISIVGCTILIIMISALLIKKNNDINASQSVIDKIQNLGVITLESYDEIESIQEEYSTLTMKQRELVKNIQIYLDAKKELEELIDEEIKNDPNSALEKKDLNGIWIANKSSDNFRGYLYFTSQGYVYYCSSKSPLTVRDFTDEYLIATSYSLGQYNWLIRAKEGSFKTIYGDRNYKYTVKKTEEGKMEINIQGEIIGGVYTKSGEIIDNSPKKCLHEGCKREQVTSGDSRYCEIHSNKCLQCGCYIDEDALYCLNCLVEALRKIK